MVLELSAGRDGSGGKGAGGVSNVLSTALGAGEITPSRRESSGQRAAAACNADAPSFCTGAGIRPIRKRTARRAGVKRLRTARRRLGGSFVATAQTVSCSRFARVAGRLRPAVYFAKYVVARFWPTERIFFRLSPSLRIRGSSLACMLSSVRICSARRPFFRLPRRDTTTSRVFAMSSADLRGRRPFRAAGARPARGAKAALAARGSARWPLPPSRISWSDELFTASRTESTNDAASREIRE